jgi:hypothetical protein
VEPKAAIRDAVVRCIDTRDHPVMEERARALDEVVRLLEDIVRERLEAERVAVSLDGLDARCAVSDAPATLNSTGAFYTLSVGWGREADTDSRMLPMEAHLSVEPQAVSIVRVAGLESLFDTPQSERQFQWAFHNAVWRHSFELRLS